MQSDVAAIGAMDMGTPHGGSTRLEFGVDLQCAEASRARERVSG